MMGWLRLPMSPEKTMVFVTPFSVASTVMLDEPRRCPASVKVTSTPSQRVKGSPYLRVWT